MTTVREARAELFAKLEDPSTTDEFFAHVAEQVRWTVEGTHPLAGTYHSKAEFQAATFARLEPIMRDGVKLSVQHLHLDGDIAVAELLSTSVTTEGAPFNNTYCWVCRFAGDEIVEVRAYLDSAMVAYAVNRADAAARF